jgi:hypothetical protein
MCTDRTTDGTYVRTDVALAGTGAQRKLPKCEYFPHCSGAGVTRSSPSSLPPPDTVGSSPLLAAHPGAMLDDGRASSRRRLHIPGAARGLLRWMAAVSCAVAGFSCITAQHVGTADCRDDLVPLDEKFAYDYYWAAIGSNAAQQGVIAPVLSPTCDGGDVLPCAGLGMHPGGVAHMGGWMCPMTVNSSELFAMFFFGGEGVSLDGTVVGALLDDLWALVDGQWLLMGGSSALQQAWPTPRAGFASWFYASPNNGPRGGYLFGGWAQRGAGGVNSTEECNSADMWFINVTDAAYDEATGEGTVAVAEQLSSGALDFCGQPAVGDSWPSARTEPSTWKSSWGSNTLLWMAFGRQAGPGSFSVTSGSMNDAWVYDVQNNTWALVPQPADTTKPRPPPRSSAALWALPAAQTTVVVDNSTRAFLSLAGRGNAPGVRRRRRRSEEREDDARTHPLIPLVRGNGMRQLGEEVRATHCVPRLRGQQMQGKAA